MTTSSSLCVDQALQFFWLSFQISSAFLILILLLQKPGARLCKHSHRHTVSHSQSQKQTESKSYSCCWCSFKWKVKCAVVSSSFSIPSYASLPLIIMELFMAANVGEIMRGERERVRDFSALFNIKAQNISKQNQTIFLLLFLLVSFWWERSVKFFYLICLFLLSFFIKGSSFSFFPHSMLLTALLPVFAFAGRGASFVNRRRCCCFWLLEGVL